MKTIKLAILGFGNAGKAFAKLLLEKEEEIREIYKTQVMVTAITTGTRGNLINHCGIDLRKALDSIEKEGKFAETWDSFSKSSSIDVVKEADYDVLLELTPLEIFSGQPATNHIKGAFKRGKHVITANKGPIAWHFRELAYLALESKSMFFYETTVMDGTPVFNLIKDTLKFCKVTEVKGILNSTTNFVLEELQKGVQYDEVIREGKRRGFIEADPAMDIEGWDAAAKTAALLNVLMEAGTNPTKIKRKGIENITASELEGVSKRGNTIKLICRGTMKNGEVVGSVAPEEISKGELYGIIDGTSSVVSITTDLMGTLSIVEHEPEIGQTAYGIFSDLIRTIEGMD